MDSIAAVMFEPVGCLAEFPPENFDLAARELFGLSAEAAGSGSRAYWRLLGFIQQRTGAMEAAQLARLEELELAAVAQVELYEDVVASLEKLRSAGPRAYLVSSLSRQAVARFIERFSLGGLFAGSIAREDAQGVMARPLRHALAQASLDPRQVIYLADTAEALEISKQVGVNSLLMINDYDEGRALAERSPAGGLVSLAELPDALALIEQRAGLRSTARMPLKPFELFEPG